MLCLRVTNSLDVKHLEGLFEYLEEETIVKDKAGMYQCIEATVKKIFRIFVEAKEKQVYNHI